jgi:hypothetical protein
VNHVDHVDDAALVDYWLSQGDDDAVEQHLLACAQCTGRLEWVARFTRGVQEVVRRGNLGIVLTSEFLARLSQEGLRVRTYAPPAGGGVLCTVTRADDLLMGRLQTDLSSVSRLDVLLLGAAGELRARLEDIPFRPNAAAEVVLNQPIDVARATGADLMVMKLVAVENGADRLLSEYTFNHTPTLQ